jgi:hypothetical protein
MRAFPDLASGAPLKEKFHEGELWNLIGVIVSRVIVLFDFREEQHERGAAEDALIDRADSPSTTRALITVGATDAGALPRALHGGPLWQALFTPKSAR